ncbi:hypothetical protein AVEN_92636-1 [Araneus ventricosus]|uniref:Uncharacterized protein n=1 Tax=Araneus ventricosus TaxID=182803 RepID=A0A4Y2AI71_ARAVE|nr:hypothetical protein AVEN_92636-1 [Araneus ventricosus]
MKYPFASYYRRREIQGSGEGGCPNIPQISGDFLCIRHPFRQVEDTHRCLNAPSRKQGLDFYSSVIYPLVFTTPWGKRAIAFHSVSLHYSRLEVCRMR